MPLSRPLLNYLSIKQAAGTIVNLTDVPPQDAGSVALPDPRSIPEQHVCSGSRMVAVLTSTLNAWSSRWRNSSLWNSYAILSHFSDITLSLSITPDFLFCRLKLHTAFHVAKNYKFRFNTLSTFYSQYCLSDYVDSRGVHLSKVAQQQGLEITMRARSSSHMTCDEGRPCRRWWVLLLVWIESSCLFTAHFIVWLPSFFLSFWFRWIQLFVYSSVPFRNIKPNL